MVRQFLDFIASIHPVYFYSNWSYLAILIIGSFFQMPFKFFKAIAMATECITLYYN